MCMADCYRMCSVNRVLMFHEYSYSHTLLNIENILIRCTIGRPLFLLTIAMQIKHINIIEALHQALAHPTEGRVIQVAVIGNESKDAIASLLNAPLGKADKLHVV